MYRQQQWKKCHVVQRSYTLLLSHHCSGWLLAMIPKGTFLLSVIPVSKLLPSRAKQLIVRLSSNSHQFLTLTWNSRISDICWAFNGSIRKFSCIQSVLKVLVVVSLDPYAFHPSKPEIGLEDFPLESTDHKKTHNPASQFSGLTMGKNSWSWWHVLNGRPKDDPVEESMYDDIELS